MAKARLKSAARHMNQVEAAYIGAVLDTDGYIGCFKRRRTKSRSRKAYEHRLQVKLGESELSFELISALIRATGVGHVSTAKPSSIGRRTVWIWRVQSQNTVADIISQVQQYSWKAQFACPHTKEVINGLG